MTLNEMTFDIITALRLHSDDVDITEDYIEHLINQYRNRYARRDYNKRPYIPIDLRQSIVIPMEVVNSSVIDHLKQTNTVILRTEYELPSFLTLGKQPGIFTLSTIDRNKGEFELMEKRRARYAQDSPTCSTVTYLDTDNKLYVESKKDSYNALKYIVIDAVLEDPREAIGFLYIDEDGTVPPVAPIEELGKYPISSAMWTYVKSDVINEILRIRVTAPDLEAAAPVMNKDPQSLDGDTAYRTDTSQGV